MSEAPTETESSDAGQAVNSPTLEQLRQERLRRIEALREAIAALGGEIEEFDPELNQDPVPPGHAAAFKISSAMHEFFEEQQRHIKHVEQNIETPFKRAWTPTPEVFDALLIVSMELGDVLEGLHSPDAILRAAAAIVDDGVVQARQALAVERCSGALESWRVVRRDADERGLDAEAASEKLDFYSSALINALVEIEPGFRKLKAREVASTIRAGRKDQGGVALLLDLRTKARVWRTASRKSLYRAVEKHSKKAST